MTTQGHAGRDAAGTRIRASTQDGSYPRPQLVREHWVSLDGPWGFAHDNLDVGQKNRWFDPDMGHIFSHTITVPFVPESVASGIDEPGFHPIVWYRRVLTVTAQPGFRHLLHFGAVDHTAQVWVDGRLVAQHVGGQTSFTADITDALAEGSAHVLVVRAFDDPGTTELPRGKQDWRLEPHFIWYRRSTGIWRSVWLETVGQQHVTSLDWSTDHTTSTVCATVILARPPAPETILRVTLTFGEEPLAELNLVVTDARNSVSVQLPALRNAMQREAYLWSPEQPALVDASVKVDVGGATVDEVASYLGIRSTGTDRGRFLLNNRPYYMRSVLEQGYWTESHLTAPNLAAYREEIEIIKELGFNAARLHQKVEDPRMLYWADRLGLLIWGETAGAYEYTATAATALIREWADIVAQNRNHPSIVTWVPVNESWGVQDLAGSPAQESFVRAITAFTRALDPSRPVVSNDGWEHLDSDIITLHDYSSNARVLVDRYASRVALAATLDGMGPQGRRPILDQGQRGLVEEGHLPLMLTEFGGISYSGDGTWGYTVVSSDADYREQLAAVFDAVQSSPIIAGFCYTQLTDTLQESNGLLRHDRSPKLPIEVLRAIVTGTAEMATS